MLGSVFELIRALRVAVDDLTSLLEGGDLGGLFDDQVGSVVVEVSRLQRRLDAVRLAATAEVGRRTIAENEGFTSSTAWLAGRTGQTWGQARAEVGLARSLMEMPLTLEAFASGGIDVRRAKRLAGAHAVDAVVFARDEQVLVDAARTLKPRDLRTTIDYWRQAADRERFAAEEQAMYERRSVYLSETFSGMGRLDGDLDPESLTVVATALAARCEPQARDGDQRTAAQRRADALVDVCRFFLDQGDTPVHGGQRPHIEVSVDLEVLEGRAPDAARLGASIVVDAETARRLACDAAVSRVVTRGPSEVLDVGRRTRVVPVAVRRALARRDHHCTWDGCDRPAHWCDAHHIQHWAEGGQTNLENLQLLCRPHHRMAHEAMAQPP